MNLFSFESLCFVICFLVIIFFVEISFVLFLKNQFMIIFFFFELNESIKVWGSLKGGCDLFLLFLLECVEYDFVEDYGCVECLQCFYGCGGWEFQEGFGDVGCGEG